MDREKIYNEWLNLEFEGERFCNKETIKTCNKVTDNNFKYYIEYQNDCLDKNENVKSFKGRRSKILDFLSSDALLHKDLGAIEQEEVEEYILSYLNKESDSSYVARINYLKKFLDFHKGILKNKIDISHLKIQKDEMTTSDLTTKKSLSAEQISLCRELYKEDLPRLFIFEMLYSTDINKDELKRLRYSDFDIIDNSFKVKGKKIYVSNYIAQMVMQLKDSTIMTQAYDIDWLVDKMKTDLQKFGVENLKLKDIKETRENVYWRCPQCGERYEAIVDNWCACQYTSDGKYWIVCKENCGKYE